MKHVTNLGTPVTRPAPDANRKIGAARLAPSASIGGHSGLAFAMLRDV
jgi:hypothetical protein